MANKEFVVAFSAIEARCVRAAMTQALLEVGPVHQSEPGAPKIVIDGLDGREADGLSTDSTNAY